jgi:hypothetical protein
VTNVYRTTATSNVRPTYSTIESIGAPVTTKSTITTINPGVPKVVYTEELEPVVTSIRQISDPNNQFVSSVTSKVVNEEVIDHNESLLRNEIRKLRLSAKNTHNNERDISMYKQKIAVLSQEVLNDDLKNKRVTK